MNWRPISYPRITGNVADTINALLARAQPIELASGGGYSIRTFAVRERCDTCLSLGIEVGGAAMDVHLSPAALEGLLTDLLSRRAFAALDEDLQLAVLETALAEPLDALKRYLQTPVTLTGVRRNGKPPRQAGPAGKRQVPPHSLQFEIRRHADDALFAVQVDLNSGLPEPARSVLGDSGACRRRDLGYLPAPVVLELGSASLPASELRSLEPGDIVLFDECYIGGGQLRVNVGDLLFRTVRVNGAQLTVSAPEGSEPASG